VHRGDVLYEIDPIDYQVAIANAEATATSRYEDLQNKLAESKRRQELTTLSASIEEQQTYVTTARIASSDYAAAVAQLNQAKVNLGRTRVVSPVNGYVTNLQLHEGDYAVAGTRNLALLDADSFWAVGYFEETKLAGIHLGDQAIVALLGFRDPVRGHVESIARGIDTPNTTPGALGLASVDPVFTWVRLAQRIPVRIHIDAIRTSRSQRV
jgi:multidrug resistance efflux pump